MDRVQALYREMAARYGLVREVRAEREGTVTNPGDTFHIRGIADEHHKHDELAQRLTLLGVRLDEMRAEWDEFIAANTSQEPPVQAPCLLPHLPHNHPPGTDHPDGKHGCHACAIEIAERFAIPAE